MFVDQANKLCLEMAQQTLARIRADRKRVSVRVAELLAMIEERLFDPDLQIETLLRWCGADKNVSTRFAEELKRTPWAYITHCRLEVAGRMLAASDVKIWRIATSVGYPTANSFGRVFKRWAKKTPSQFRDEAARADAESAAAPAPAEVLSQDELRRALDGDLPPEKADAMLGRLGELRDRITANYQVLTPPPSRAAWVEPVMADNVWQFISGLSHEAQRAAVESQAGSFRTAALFHRLCTESIETGAVDDVRGLQLAALAMSALEAVGERLKDPSLFARAYAVSGLAFQRSGKPDDAGECFGIATRLLDLAGEEIHPVVTMELCLYQSIYHLERDEIEEAAMLIEAGSQLHLALLAKLEQQASAAAGDEGDDGAE